MRHGTPGTALGIDVVLPIRSPAPWLEETLEGLEQQSFKSWNLICTVHESSMQLRGTVIDHFPSAHIITVSDDLRLPSVLNIGIRSGTAQYIARIDADDVPHPDRLRRQFDFMQAHSDVAVVATPVTVIDATGQAHGISFDMATSDIRKRLMMKNCIIHPSIMMRRAVFTSVGGYNEDAINGEDYELWLRIASTNRIACLNEPLLKYRRHHAQVSTVGAMDAKARGTIRRARIQLAGEGLIHRLKAEYSHAVWTAPQMWRHWRRRSRSSNV